MRQLDPEHVGISITVVLCMPPCADGKVHSLRENVGIGTPPWEGDLTAKALFLGAESLAGHVVSSFHYENVDDLRNRTFVPAYQTEHEISSIAWPISGQVARQVACCFQARCRIITGLTRAAYWLRIMRVCWRLHFGLISFTLTR